MSVDPEAPHVDDPPFRWCVTSVEPYAPHVDNRSFLVKETPSAKPTMENAKHGASGGSKPRAMNDKKEVSSVESVLTEEFYDAKSIEGADESLGPGGSNGSWSFVRKSTKRRPSDVGSIPLNIHSLEIVNGLAPGEPIPGLDSEDSKGNPNSASSAPVELFPVEEKHNSKEKLQVTVAAETDEEEVIDFLQDDPASMTYGRRIALYMMKRYKWYNPQFTEGEAKEVPAVINADGRFRTQDGYPVTHSKLEHPSLEKAWAYFDHVALPRYLFHPKENDEKKGIFTRIIRKWSKANKQLQRAEPGECENETRLYSPLFTPHKQLGDFGLGIGLYFSTLRALTILVFVAGLIHIPNFMYFSGAEYSAGQTDVSSLMRGSAVCTETDWVACPDCQETNFRGDSWLRDPIRNATFARKNLCDGATLQEGMVNYGALIFVVIATFVLNRYLHTMEVQFDEDEQTAQDYSIIVNNPPDDATGPEEWREYFKRAFDADVTGCTVAVYNDLLVRSLVERREKMRMLELMVEPGTKLDIVTLAGIAAAQERERTALQGILALVSPGIPEIFSRLAVLTAKVQGLAQQDYPVTKVFITFETESDQRRVLQKLSLGQAAVDANRTSTLGDAKFLFRGTQVLSVSEPEEPDSIRWNDLNVTFFDSFKQQCFTALATVAALILVAFLVAVVNDTSPAATAYTISIANSIFPMFAKTLTFGEAHPSHGSLQTSLYFKIAIFRWVTTAIVITIVTPFENTLYAAKGGLIRQIEAQFFAEVTTSSLIQLTDPFGHVQRHFSAPRATTQDAMNLLMQGSKFELAERYTAAAKLLFLTFWYCSIYPGAFFWCAFAMQVIYYLDKLSLTRTWKRVPKLGSTISQFNRTYFLPLSVAAMAVLSSYYWSGFPFDNLCAIENATVTQNYVGFVNIPVAKKETIADLVAALEGNTTLPQIERYVNFTVEADSTFYMYCNQNLLNPFRFPFVPQRQGGETWMTEDQETVTTIYGWTACAFIAAYVLLVIAKIIWTFFGYFSGHYVPTGDVQGQSFSDLESKNIYIPQIESAVFSYPLLACTVDHIDDELLDWTDPEHPHAFYDLTKDAQALIRGSDISEKVVFSQVAHWPPAKED